MKRLILYLCLSITVVLHATKPITVVTTIPDLGWMVKEIGQHDVVVQSFLTGSEDPHYVDAVPKFVLWASRADMIVSAGLDLEVGWLPKVLEQSANAKVQPGGIGYCEVGNYVTVLEKPTTLTNRSMGDIHPRGNPHFYLSPKIQFDYETRRIYAMTSHQILRVQHDNFDTTKAKAGFSFYKTEYNETQPWFILELIHTNSMSKKLEIIPTIRLINKALYLEAGVSTDGNPKLHLMHTF